MKKASERQLPTSKITRYKDTLMKKLSVIVPVYGEDEYLDECIESIVNQTYKNLEIILVDDGSPDRCPEICDKWAETDNRIVVIHKPNGGLVSGRKAGMDRATGDYIGYVDGDDWIEPDYLMNLITQLEQNDADIAMSGFVKDLFGKTIECKNLLECGCYQKNDIETKIIPGMMCMEDTNLGSVYTYVWNKVFKADIVRDCQQMVDNRVVIGEDSTVVYPAILKAERICITNDTGYHYRQRMNSLLRSAVYKAESIEKLRIFYAGLYSIFEKSKYRDLLLKQLKNFYISHLLMMSDSLVHFYPELKDNFPYTGIEENSLVAVYSAGAYGIHVYSQLNNSEDFKVCAWADPDYEQYVGRDARVIAPEELKNIEFDYCIIASTNRMFVDESKKILSGYGIAETKICTVFENLDFAEKQLDQIGLMKRDL